MKKLLALLLLTTLFISCSKDDDNLTQSYTSFVVKNTSGSVCKNVVAGYRLPDNTIKEIARLGDLAKGETSIAVKVDFANIKEILLFSGYFPYGNYSYIFIFTDYKKFTLKENTKNIYSIPENSLMDVTYIDSSDPKQYPQK